jgi:hypothetical protein
MQCCQASISTNGSRHLSSDAFDQAAFLQHTILATPLRAINASLA